MAEVRTAFGDKKYVGFPLRFFQSLPSDPWRAMRISLSSPLQPEGLASEESLELIEMSGNSEIGRRKSDGLERALEYMISGESEEDEREKGKANKRRAVLEVGYEV